MFKLIMRVHIRLDNGDDDDDNEYTDTDTNDDSHLHVFPPELPSVRHDKRGPSAYYSPHLFSYAVSSPSETLGRDSKCVCDVSIDLRIIYHCYEADHGRQKRKKRGKVCCSLFHSLPITFPSSLSESAYDPA